MALTDLQLRSLLPQPTKNRLGVPPCLDHLKGCDGLNGECPHRLRCLTLGSQLGALFGAVVQPRWRKHITRGALGIHSLPHFLSALSLLLFVPRLPTTVDSYPSGTMCQSFFFFNLCSWCCVITTEKSLIQTHSLKHQRGVLLSFLNTVEFTWDHTRARQGVCH